MWTEGVRKVGRRGRRRGGGRENEFAHPSSRSLSLCCAYPLLFTLYTPAFADRSSIIVIFKSVPLRLSPATCSGLRFKKVVTPPPHRSVNYTEAENPASPFASYLMRVPSGRNGQAGEALASLSGGDSSDKDGWLQQRRAPPSTSFLFEGKPEANALSFHVLACVWMPALIVPLAQSVWRLAGTAPVRCMYCERRSRECSGSLKKDTRVRDSRSSKR